MNLARQARGGLRALGWWLCACLVASARPGDFEAVRRYDLPGGEAADALREFARASNLQLLFPERAVRGVQLPPLHGEFSARDALERLLADSGLVAISDASTGAYAVRRGAPVPSRSELKNAAELLRMPSARVANEPALEMEPVRIEQRRDFGVTTQSILRADRAAALYHTVMTRAEIEQSGVTNMAELVTTLPGYSGEGAEALQATADFTFLGGANVYAGSFLKLRGFDAQHTTVLLNGRRLPTSPESHGPDLSRIPLAAVERIELLPFAGSAVYGDGAVGGAMNIVLRKDYSGQSFSFQMGESTRGGGGEHFFTWIDGLASANGRTKATIIGDYQHRTALRLGDRDFLARAIARLPPDRLLPAGGSLGSDLRGVLGAELAGYPAVFAAPASTIDLGIPGKPGALFALVPPGRNAAQLTPDEFVETNPASLGERRQNRVVLRRPTETFNLNVQLEHAIAPETFELYGEIGYARAEEKFAAPDTIEPVSLSATDPRNPFRNQVTPGFAGRGVTLLFDPVDLPDARFKQMRDSARGVLGARGAVSQRWTWVLDGFVDLSRSRANLHSYGASLNELLRVWGQPQLNANSIVAANANALAAIYDPLADHRTSPVPVDTRERYLARHSWLDYRSVMVGADFRVGGNILDLPAGPLRVALGGEYAWRNLSTWQQVDASRELYALPLLAQPSAFETLTQPYSRDDRGHRIGGVAEAVVPLYRARQRPALLQSAELNLASRVARTDQWRPAASNLAALKLAPSGSWAVRGTISQGYVTPESALLHGPITETTTMASARDSQRGGTQQVYQLRVVRGGSPRVRAETSQSRVIGLLFTPAWAPGLFVSVDAWSIWMKNRLREPTVQEMIERADIFPDRIERGAPQPWEFALGWAGPVTRVDLRPMQVTRMQSDGVDVALKYRLPPTRAGLFTLGGQLEIVQRYEEQFLPGDAPIDKVNVVADASNGGLMESAVVSPRARASLGWQRASWSASLGMTYTPRYQTDSTTPTATLPGATGLDGDFIGSSTRWDLQFGYLVSGRRDSGWRGWLSNTQWTVGVRNIFDAEPAYRSDGTSFYSRFDDPRMRFIYARVQWRR